MYDDLQLLLLDVDGVLTDGSLLIDETGRSVQRFNIKDGMGIRAWQSCGFQVGLLSARSGRAVTLRAMELDIDLVTLGAADKLTGYENLCRRVGVRDEQVVYIGDDLNDLPVLCRVALPIAPADAVSEVRQVAKRVTEAKGGRGCVREAVEHVLKEKGLWDRVLERYGL